MKLVWGSTCALPAIILTLDLTPPLLLKPSLLRLNVSSLIFYHTQLVQLFSLLFPVVLYAGEGCQY